MPLYKLENKQPIIHSSAYIAPTAAVIGNVIIGKNSSVWFNCVIRGDEDAILIGKETNIQDLSVLHADPGKPISIGDGVTIGHRCIIHGCEIADHSLIGMGAIIMNGVKIGCGSIAAAGSVLLENTMIPPFSLVAGVPGKIIRTLGMEVLEKNKAVCREYVMLSRGYKSSKNWR
jgi:carbonic anhydrase/acetyltransferase-like protein (isoleucine patch superfamily)